MVSMTDMWRAAGSDPSRKPSEWMRSRTGKRFFDHLMLIKNVGISHLISVESGRNGGAWAHWQVALAYAKFLSPKFHLARKM